MSWLSDIVGGSAGQIIDSVGNVADKFITTDKEREELEISKSRLKLEEFQAEVADRGSARERETRINESQNASWLSKNISSLLAIGCLVLTFFMFYKIFGMNTNDANKDIVVYILGVLSAISTQIISYYFGSSMGSKNKSDIMERMREK
ncbi:MAG TPA: hypothetical protein PLV58_11010 [Campylobacterales bacterium]|nr:hypothetical protein [Campylobacterales bacterium]